MILPADKEKWSESSKNSYSYISSINSYYEDIAYKCYTCKVAAVFTAEEQKHAYEVEKRYIWQRRFLCHTCYSDFKKLKTRIAEFEAKWLQETEASKPDAQYLSDWLASLKLLPKYGKPANEGMIKHLSKLVHNQA